MNTQKEASYARSKCAQTAKTRLSKMHPEDYRALYLEELDKVGLTPSRILADVLIAQIKSLEEQIERMKRCEQ